MCVCVCNETLLCMHTHTPTHSLAHSRARVHLPSRGPLTKLLDGCSLPVRGVMLRRGVPTLRGPATTSTRLFVSSTNTKNNNHSKKQKQKKKSKKNSDLVSLSQNRKSLCTH